MPPQKPIPVIYCNAPQQVISKNRTIFKKKKFKQQTRINCIFLFFLFEDWVEKKFDYCIHVCLRKLERYASDIFLIKMN